MNQCVVILKRMDNGFNFSVPQNISDYTFTEAYDFTEAYKICILYLLQVSCHLFTTQV